MGILKFSDVFDPTDCHLNVKGLAGKTISVDVSAWIVQIRTGLQQHASPALCLRDLFYRTVALLKYDIKLIAVLDGLAPEVKRAAMVKRQQQQIDASISSVNRERPMLQQQGQEYRELFECFGIPCVQSQGEAEALCAHLEKIGICHGCFTNDSDYFCYGGRSMYRKLAKDKTQKKDYVVEEFMFEEEAFSQKDFVALALLIGCDFGKGIQGIGPEKGRKLLEGLKGQGFNTLDRIFSWPHNTELDDLELQLDNKGKKKTHCKTCNHEGSEGKHEKKGCQTCGTEISCTSTSPRLCDCEWHACDRKLEPVSLELSIRKKSRANPDFPSAEIRDEFLNNSAQHCFNPTETRLTQGQLDIRKLVAWLTSKNVLREADILRYIIPLVLLRQMRDPSLTEMFTPLRIQKKCKENHEQCYQVLWDKSDQNTWARPPYETSFQEKVSQQLFQQRYPHLVRMFEEPNPGASKGKRKKTQMDTRQRTLKHYYLVKKKKLFREETKP